MKKAFILMSPMLAMLLIALFAMRFMSPKVCAQNRGVAAVGTLRFNVALAVTPKDWEHGLSDRPLLARDEGMLFIFPEASMRSFWMKDMHFPIDIVWIDNDWKIVGIEHNATPESYPATFPSPIPIKRVLEIPSFAHEPQSLRVGDSVEFGCL